MALSDLANEIIELDRLNMEAHFIASGETFDSARREAGLGSEIQEGAQFLQVRRSGELIAYLEYLPPQDGKFRIPSLQVHPTYRGTSILRPLLAQAAHRIGSWPDAMLQTRVHSTNSKSIRLHSRLGFSHVASSDGRLVFTISVSALRAKLQTYSGLTQRSSGAHKPDDVNSNDPG